jgi:hypothetical protein
MVLSLASCAKMLSGKYTCSVLGVETSYEFSGNKVVVTAEILGFEKDFEGTYEIKDNNEGKTVIVFTFGDDDASKYAGEFDFSEGTEDGKSYIKIGGVQYKKVD